MKPKKLEFSGIKSYVNTCSIDFDKLSQSGLFGIFGDTGSGKSTILDGIFIALYGRLPSSNSVTDFINKKAGACVVDFSFEIEVFNERKTYGVKREYRLKGDRKNVPAPKASLFEIKGNIKEPIAEDTARVNSKIQEIIGLELSDFQKCIVLPQGQFSAFVTMQRAARLNMVSGLFNLDKYGESLEAKLKKKQSGIFNKISAKNEGLSYYAFDTKEAVISCKNELEETKKILDDLTVKKSKITDEFNEIKEIYVKCKNLKDCEEQLLSREKLLPKIEEKKALLKDYLKVAELSKIVEEKQKIASKIDKNKKEYSDLLVEYEGVKSQIFALEELSKDDGAKSDRIVEINTRLALLEQFKDDFEINEKRAEELTLLRKRVREDGAYLDGLKKKLSVLKDSLCALENSPQTLSLQDKIQGQIDLIIHSAKSAFIQEEIVFLNDLKKLANAAAVDLIDERIKWLSPLLSRGETVEVENAVKALNELYSLNDEISSKRLELNKSISQTEGDVSLFSANVQATTQKGIDLKKEWDTAVERLKKLTDGEDLSLLTSKLLKEKQDLTDDMQRRKERQTSLSLKLSTCLEALSAKEGEISQMKASLADYDEKIQVKRAEFKDPDGAILSSKTVKDYDGELKSVEDFEVEYKALLKNKAAWEKSLGKTRVTEEIYLEKEKIFNDVTEKHSITDKNYYKLTQTYENLSLNFAKRCKIEQEISALAREKETVDKLYEAVKGKKFLEFIADEYLLEIAVEAKKILLDLSGGKYGLKYQGEFFVEDNFRGGILRRVDTVSGGELFLLSLSLSLALSKSICQKSSRPIEFFFLDEGFGSLDNGLLQVVLDCLDKLKNSSFTIGVISHVDALKERIPAKINVVAGDLEKGSTISMTV